MSFAIRKDGTSWRAVDSAADCTTDEVWQLEVPAPIVAPAAPIVNPVEKLQTFLQDNPDVAALIGAE